MIHYPILFISLGPGDPELITLKGWKALQAADIVFCPETTGRDGQRTSRAADIVRRLSVGDDHIRRFLLPAGFYSSVHYVFERLRADGRAAEHVAGIPAFIAAGALAGLHTASQEQRLTVLPGTATAQELERLVDDGGTVVIMKLSQCADEVHRCMALHPEYTYHYFENVGTATEFYTCDAAVVAARRFPYFSLMIVQG